MRELLAMRSGDAEGVSDEEWRRERSQVEMSHEGGILGDEGR